uniref:PheS_1 protein n=1 Tax=Fopius arisanus TaxID=64838 RepID=A0A0C9PRI2_9HYME
MGLKEECNDPYAPGPAIDLVECRQNESHYCLKAAIYYKNVHATVRGCVPLRWKNTYCSPRDEFAEARVTCKFCNENACNASWIPVMNGDSITSIFIVVVMNFVLG